MTGPSEARAVVGAPAAAGMARFSPWLLAWGLLPIAVGIVARYSGLDLWLADYFFSADANGFPARASNVLEVVGHRSAKSIVLACWFVLAGAAIAAHFDPATRRWRPLLWATVIGMALGPVIVSSLKSITMFHCPWDLTRYGGLTDDAGSVFVMPARAGQCFPAGHSAGGFSLFAIGLGLWAAGARRGARIALVVAVIVGVAFSFVRIAQGAHFLSHTLWAAGIDWIAAALPFCWLYWRGYLDALPAAPDPFEASADISASPAPAAPQRSA